MDHDNALTNLDLTSNWLADWNQVDYLTKHIPSLKELGLRCNPLASKKRYRGLVFKRMPNLHRLDGFPFSEKDKEQIKGETKPLTSDMIFDVVKDSRKGLFELPPPPDTEDRLREDDDLEPQDTSPIKYEKLEHKPNWEL